VIRGADDAGKDAGAGGPGREALRAALLVSGASLAAALDREAVRGGAAGFPAYAPAGILLAAMVAWGPRAAASIFLAAFAAAFVESGRAGAALASAGGATLQTLLAAVLLARAGFRPALDRIRDVALLFVLGAAPPAAVSAAAAAAGAWGSHLPGSDSPAGLFWAAWSRHVVGALAVAPCLLTLGSWRALLGRPGRRLEAAALAGALAALSAITLHMPREVAAMGGHFEYLVFPALLWAARRFGPAGAAAAALAASLSAASGAVLGRGSFGLQDLHGTQIPLQAFIATIVFTGLTFAAADAERRTLDQRLRQSEKLEAIGRLAGGIAHDFNNLLTVIKGYISLVAERLEDDPEGRSQAAAVERAAARAAALTRQILDFSRRQPQAPGAVDVNAVLSEIAPMLGRVIGERVELRLALADGPLRARGDPAHLEQVIVNLVANARDAMPRGGVLTLATERLTGVRPQGSPAGAGRGLEPGAYVAVSVTDTGVGMDAEVRGRLFEPFFTTKPVGQGTGLGLSSAYGVVRSWGGDIEVETEPGRGTTFRVVLPYASAAPEATPAPAPEAGAPAAATVLVVEDEPEVRAVAREVLARAGFLVVTTGDPDEAIEAVAERGRGRLPAPFDLVLCDVVLPRLGGPELVARLRGVQPGIKAVLMTGYSDVLDDVGGPGEGTERDLLVRKPFTPAELLGAVRKALEGENGGRAPA
jgi:signal transduction histidine kinase/ActR/RegA family two-component response regulator